MNEPEKEKIIQLSTGYDAFSPEILPYEIGNALAAMVKRQYLPTKDVIKVYKAIQRIPVTLVKLDILESLEIGLKFDIYAYDAYFLNCAQTLNYPLLTLDKKMKTVASQLNIKILE